MNKRFSRIVLLASVGAGLMLASSFVYAQETTLTAVRVETLSTDPLDAMWSDVPSLAVTLVGDEVEPSVRNGITFDLVQAVDLQAVYTDDMVVIRAV